MNNQQTRDFIKTIKLFYDNGCLADVIVVGSWAEYLYSESGILPGYNPNIRTLDVDILIINQRKPRPAVDFIKLARKEGYLLESERLTGVTKLLLPGSLEIEFLLPKRGAGKEASMKTSFGVTAQTLRHLEVLINNTIVVEYFCMQLIVPCPEAFVLHKMMIQKERRGKAEKDRAAISGMYPHLNNKRLEAIRLTLPTEAQKRIQAYIDAYMK